MNDARGQFADFFGRLWREKPLGIASGIVILILILLAIFADALAPYPVDQLNLAERLQGSSTRHLLGTDQLGRDQLSRLLVGARISLVVGLAATTLNVVVATLIGATSGFLGGKLDLAVQRFVDAWMAFPGLLLLLTIMSIAGQGLPQIIVVLGIAGGVGGSRVVRGAVVATKENDFFLAARAVGAPTRQVLVRHVLPNIVAPLIIVFSINVGGVRRRHPGRGELELSRVRVARQCPQLGRDAQPGGAAVHGAGAVAGAVARAVPDDRGVQFQHAGRRDAGLARSAAARRGSSGCGRRHVGLTEEFFVGGSRQTASDAGREERPRVGRLIGLSPVSATGWIGTTPTTPCRMRTTTPSGIFLKRCHENGWLSRGTDSMPWCARCGTRTTNCPST